MHRLPHVHVGVSVHGRSLVQLGRAEACDADVATHQKHVVEKCTMCWHRLAKGLQPACVEVCPGRVRFFGDFNDPESEVSRLLRERAHKQLLPERGTNPSVYYLV